MSDLTIVIPARNEIFLSKTIENILNNIMGDTEIIAVLDGYWPVPPIEDNPHVTLVHHAESIGQRAACNEAVRLSKARYVCKMDAHISIDRGWDVKMMEAMDSFGEFVCEDGHRNVKDNNGKCIQLIDGKHSEFCGKNTYYENCVTAVSAMRNLHAFDWVCKKCGARIYQGQTPSVCLKCDNASDFEKDIVWIGKSNPISTSYCFDPEPHFQYFKEFKSRPEGKPDKNGLTETMSLQGSCFMLTREKWWELDVCGEEFGSWGSQGIEVSAKTWLSGGRVICNHNTWYAHMFRTKGGDFGFPYPISGRQIKSAKQYARDLFFNNKWPKQKRQISWLVEKFWPVPGWSQEQLDELKNGEKVEIIERDVSPAPHTSCEQKEGPTKGIVYYTDNRCDEKLLRLCQDHLLRAAHGARIVSVSLKPIIFEENVILHLERGYLAMFKQILAGIERCETDIIYLSEHDVIYSPEHFEFTPPTKDIFYYNKNNWQVRQSDGHAVYWDCKKVSQICAYRDLILEHYRKRVKMVEEVGFSRRMGFEPGTHRRSERVDNTTSTFFTTEIPNLDIRHAKNLTSSRWSPDQFRNPCKNWTESHVNKLLGWENLVL